MSECRVTIRLLSKRTVDVQQRRLSGSLSPSENVGILDDAELRRPSISDFQDAPPLGEVGAISLVFFALVQESVESLSRALVVGAGQRNDALVDFDSDLEVEEEEREREEEMGEKRGSRRTRRRRKEEQEEEGEEYKENEFPSVDASLRRS